jgi:hypothetical protein
MKRLKKTDTIKLGAFIYVPASGFILQTSKRWISRGMFTHVDTANAMLRNGTVIYLMD